MLLNPMYREDDRSKTFVKMGHRKHAYLCLCRLPVREVRFFDLHWANLLRLILPTIRLITSLCETRIRAVRAVKPHSAWFRWFSPRLFWAGACRCESSHLVMAFQVGQPNPVQCSVYYPQQQVIRQAVRGLISAVRLRHLIGSYVVDYRNCLTCLFM